MGENSASSAAKKGLPTQQGHNQWYNEKNCNPLCPISLVCGDCGSIGLPKEQEQGGVGEWSGLHYIYGVTSGYCGAPLISQCMSDQNQAVSYGSLPTLMFVLGCYDVSRGLADEATLHALLISAT